jgi:transposase
MVSHQYTYAYGAVSIEDGQLDSLILPWINTPCMQIFLDTVAQRYPQELIVMVLDGAGWHKGGDLKIPDNMRLLTLPPYSPELNPMENIWEELREKHFHNKVFSSLDILVDHLCDSLRSLEQNPEITKSIAARSWIVKAIQK